jgi:2-dehydropantoate 2-reductase
MREVEAVAKAKGLTIPEGTVDRLIKECTVVKTGLPSSMLFDCLANRAMEVEVILGTPLKEGKRLGVPVPTLTA